jgi:hypothetical protein
MCWSPFTVPYSRDLEDVAIGWTVNSDGCGVVGSYWGRIVSGCGGPIRTEYTIFERTVPQRTDPFRRVSLRTKRLHAWFPLAGNPSIRSLSPFTLCTSVFNSRIRLNNSCSVGHPTVRAVLAMCAILHSWLARLMSACPGKHSIFAFGGSDAS